ncbi:hypothetical protein [Clostridium sp. YIM B02506]|uniref:hypothetical protein n=1 Tax=Clostridium sp. YIM B02506 TaxID=2910680 RepID=UPI001EEE5562|nr:hypothetical protein [Clostridium sp. YIM B02506]
MSLKRFINIIKHFILIFIFLIFMIIIKSRGYELQDIYQKSLGAGWLMVYNYRKVNTSFRLDFGYGFLVITIILSVFIELVKSYICNIKLK